MMMTACFALSAIRTRFVLLGLWLLLAVPGFAQLVVYEMDFQRTHGFNDRPFLGGYFVGPVTGGTASFVFVQGGSSGVAVVPVENGGRLFRAVTDDGKVKWVAQGQVGGGGTTPPATDDGTTGEATPDAPSETEGVVNNGVSISTGSLLATGGADFNATLRTPLVTFESRIASSLKGRSISSSSAPFAAEIDDDDDETTPPVASNDRRIGFVSRGDWRLGYDERQTAEVNRQDMTLSEATNYLEQLLLSQFEGGGQPVDRTLRILTSSPLPGATVSQIYAAQLQGTGGTGARSWSLASGSALPAGLSLAPTGLISGTPTTAGAFKFSVILQDSASPPQTVSRRYSLTVAARLTITTASPLANGRVGEVYPTVTLSTTGQTGALTWTLNPGSALPAGLSLSTAGQIAGTPTVAGAFTFTIRVQDSTSGQVATQNFQLTIDP